jgi:hypothetical protein
VLRKNDIDADARTTGRTLPRWLRRALLILLFAAAAAAFYFNYGRLFDRLWD